MGKILFHKAAPPQYCYVTVILPVCPGLGHRADSHEFVSTLNFLQTQTNFFPSFRPNRCWPKHCTWNISLFFMGIQCEVFTRWFSSTCVIRITERWLCLPLMKLFTTVSLLADDRKLSYEIKRVWARGSVQGEATSGKSPSLPLSRIPSFVPYYYPTFDLATSPTIFFQLSSTYPGY